MTEFQNLMLHLVPWILGLIVALQVWIVKGLAAINQWRVRVDTKLETVPDRVAALERWKTRSSALDEPDKELRSQIPGILQRLDRHSEELQDIRKEQLKDRERNNTKLDILITKFDTLSQNCLVHKLVADGSPETLIQLLRTHTNASKEDS